MAIVYESGNCAGQFPLTGAGRVLAGGDIAIGGDCVCCGATFVEDDGVAPIHVGIENNETAHANATSGSTYAARWALAHEACARG